MTIHVYAEHLVNIRTLSLQASLSTDSNRATRATLSADGSTLTLSHDGEVASITLPINVPGSHNDATLDLPPSPAKSLAFRVSLSEKPGAAGLLTHPGSGDANIIPWTAPALTPRTSISCRSCDSIILDRGGIQVWKDLPSENWAEMMDFWHCHRPDVPHDHGHVAPNKGYSADSRLALEPGVGMVDPVDFVLIPDDCRNIRPVALSNSTHAGDEKLQCEACQATIGLVHSSSGGYKLRKMYLSLSNDLSTPGVSYSPMKWLACHLLSAIESQGVRKFNVQSDDRGNNALKLWIFTPDITVSSSTAEDRNPMRAVKILWMDCQISDDDAGILNRQALSEGVLELPTAEWSQLREALVQSSSLLPEPSRKFQSWTVGLLPRFSNGDVGGMPRDLEHQESAAMSNGVVELPEVPDLENKEILSALTT